MLVLKFGHFKNKYLVDWCNQRFEEFQRRLKNKHTGFKQAATYSVCKPSGLLVSLFTIHFPSADHMFRAL